MSTDKSSSASTIHLIKLPNKETDNTDIEDFLKPVDELNFELDSDYSEISDVFEEFHKESFLRTNAVPDKKHLSKIEADWKTVEMFTEDFKRVMAEIRNELNINGPLLEEEEAVEAVLNSPPPPPKPVSSSTTGIESPIHIEKQNDDLSQSSCQSLVWQRLLNNSDGRFKVSPPVFDAFRQKERHWMERPPISWKVIDDCRVKCDKWLDEVIQSGGE